MNRSEQEIVYATLRDLVFSYPPLADLEEMPRIVFDYSPENILGDWFPAVGISQIGNTSRKLLDKHEDYCRTQDDADNWFVWREAGRFDMSCQVALFVSTSEKIYNPVVFLRGWSEYIEKKIIGSVNFQTSGDCIEGERISLRSSARTIEQLGKLVNSKKLTISAEGKYLIASQMKDPLTSPPRKTRIVVSAQPD